MPVKFNDVDWSHINEMKTHERFQIKKKEFNGNKDKNIVYFSKRKRLEHGQIDEENEDQGSTYRYSEEMRSRQNSKKFNLNAYKKSQTNTEGTNSQTHTDSSPRFTSVKN